MRWQLKFLKNSLLGLLPFPKHLKKNKKKLIPCNSSIDELTLEDGFQYLKMLNSVGYSANGKILLERGSLEYNTGIKVNQNLDLMFIGCLTPLIKTKKECL